MTAWYDEPGTPAAGTWWWAVEHEGPEEPGGDLTITTHPAFYLRALLPGDFAPGRAPSPRHVGTLTGDGVEGVAKCGTCGEVPEVGALDVVERASGDRGFLAPFREGRTPWPRPTDPQSCWLCGGPSRLATREVGGHKFCEGCASHLGE